MDAYLGEIRIFAFGVIPNGWSSCDGKLLNVMQNQALYSLLGNTFGGTQNSTFALPDLRGRVMLSSGIVSGTYYQTGKASGSETVSLSVSQLPPHSHFLEGQEAAGAFIVNAGGAAEILAQAVVGGTTLSPQAYTSSLASHITLNSASIGETGGGVGHENRVPVLALNICMCISGMYPMRP